MRGKEGVLEDHVNEVEEWEGNLVASCSVAFQSRAVKQFLSNTVLLWPKLYQVLSIKLKSASISAAAAAYKKTDSKREESIIACVILGCHRYRALISRMSPHRLVAFSAGRCLFLRRRLHRSWFIWRLTLSKILHGTLLCLCKQKNVDKNILGTGILVILSLPQGRVDFIWDGEYKICTLHEFKKTYPHQQNSSRNNFLLLWAKSGS